MLKIMKRTIKDNDLIPRESVLVGLSGGADSVALLHAFFELSKEYGFLVYAAHVNHGLRGDAAKRDEEFSVSFAESLGIKCFVKHSDVRNIARTEKISEELAGRKVRYEFFNELMDKYGIEYTATAHHKNDNAETVLMNFMRGSGSGGLSGIPYKRGRFIRPLLDVKRSETEKYCEEHGLLYVTDATNLENEYTRNKIRNELIPFIEEKFNPNIVNTVTSNAKIIAVENAFMDKTAQREYDRISDGDGIAIDEFLKLDIAVAWRIIRKMTEKVAGWEDISSKVIENIYDIALKNVTGLTADITKNVIARVQYGKLIIIKTDSACEDFCHTVKIGESVYIPELNASITTSYADERKNDGYEYFSSRNTISEIQIRNRRSGDVFVPSGMNGTKKVKDYMINEKIPKQLRDRIGIMTINDEIAWIIGYRRDNRFKFNGNGIKIRISY